MTSSESASPIAQNLLPGCEVRYIPDFLTPDEATTLFDDVTRAHAVDDRRVALPDGTVGEAENGAYLFADDVPLRELGSAWGGRSPWTPTLRRIRDRIHRLEGRRFGVCRVIHYADGTRGVDYHRDLPAFGPTDVIASLSVGAERLFSLRHVTSGATHELRLAHGSLLILGRGTQDHYEHALLREPNIGEARLNFTFRTFEQPG